MDGQPLPHFGAEYKEGTREATAWIPSEAGKPFSVCYRKIPGHDYHDFTARIQLDGNHASGLIHRRSKPSERWTDDDAFLTNAAAQVGDIKVVIQAVQAKAEVPPVWPTCQETEKIHERAKKGVAHRIKFSESKTRPPQVLRAYSSTPVGRPVTFVFKYRPLDTLQANGIAPRPTPPAEAHDDEEHDEDEIDVREKALLAELEEVRRQKRARNDIERPVKRAKTEPLDQLLSGDVIDLTEEREEEQKLVKQEVIDLT
ncbi:hypothetical protein BJ912DRAFT_1062122 [Pholiota molesta]|nr:hypothetical protein BJ912DRAFT_1062122 [Pholiota molesta]